MQFTRIPSDTFQKLQLNAGILASNFDPSTGDLSESDLIGATSGGVSFSATPEFTDFGEDIDNCPKNMLELKVLSSWEVTLSGTFVTMDTTAARRTIGAADIDVDDPTLVVPRNDVYESDFSDIWWIGDYSDVNSTDEGTAGFIAIRLLNALSTGGFSVTSTDEEKGTFDFEYTGHYSMDDQDKVPFEVYIKSGIATSGEES